ncbi:ATP-dependent RNA helicase RhlB [Candidatus Methylomirabilis lanthanidiphila]|uniref:ATP-dependent RNA helicase RhlB n=1 Tax=Candidatus Methylomirabilis lanthanidiphila TaxID=2211376 RepID=A0A564ZK01_9BACT|nr:DEAD/DEAH box helicase [Candidatus Methylomirabilis lanthanidiphila]VUZ85671.1 ATP-dependent RNA helicase RhlB [Candidatus Methylomirabilis lanthanidiphila]
MNVFHTHSQIVKDYETYIRSFLNIDDPAIRAIVEGELEKGKLWPEPLLQFNPAFEMAKSVADLSRDGTLHRDIADIFKGYSLYRHQVEAIELGTAGKDFIVTSGTGSGKSLTYIGSIFHHLLSNPGSPGVTSVVVYPMNALINSQSEEFNRYKDNYEAGTREFPITFGQYTGQEKEEKRQQMRENPPQVLLTNYMMLELLLTRIRERSIRDAIFENLRFLVFDELHTYRGRQGADVAMLIRRIRARCTHDVTCIGTSATMVSIGSAGSRRGEVAGVATRLFGKPFSAEQVINETLDRSLSFSGAMPTRVALAAAIQSGINPETSIEQLKTHPVAVWLENRVALELRDGHLARRTPQRISEIVAALSEDSGLADAVCRQFLAVLLQWISTVNKGLQDEGQRYTILPFKLHQFISQTGSVYTTLDQDENRFITLEPGVFKHDEDDKKPIFPNVFSRATGHAFICVSRNGNRLEPREFREISDEDDEITDGYLIIGEDVWDPAEDMEFLPPSWFRMTKGGPVPQSKQKASFPTKLYFDEFGHCSETEPLRWSGWFMKAPLLFDPTGGVFFDTKTNEGTKLTKLGSEGRSTSTTITAFSILNRLNDAGYYARDQKLLSFTDNRQDAALQAGHFNDFVQVVRLRAGIHKALREAPDNTLTYATLGEAVFLALGLPFLDYANRNEEPPLANVRRLFEQQFQTYLFYRAVADLRRSWRIILPNLEQCALLAIEYLELSEVAAEDEFWQDTTLLNQLSHEDRNDFLCTILDFFRLEYAIHSENFLTQSRLKENEKQFREMLRAPWTLDRNEELREPFFIRYYPLHRSAKLSSKSMGPGSALGKFIKLYIRQRGLDVDLRGDRYRDFILLLTKKLEQADYLKGQTARSEQNEEVPVYRLKIEKIIWRLGDGDTVKADLIKRRSYKDQAPRPNEFFREMYRRDFSNTRRLRGEDHTGQLDTDTRIAREDQFREGEISALFCSPTMELGIDIGGLNVVHLRNAPPNASNYAQRSGRAGRSGQGALVFTYCSSYSPHDRHYFQQQTELVAGAVQASRLDLCNRELLLTHLNALAVSEVGMPGLEEQGGARLSIMRLVEDDNDQMPLASEVRAGLAILPGKFNELKFGFKKVIADFAPELQNQATSWYSDQWVEQNLAELADHLDSALDRWRRLYRSARTILTTATQRIESGTLGLGSDEYRKHKRNQDQATRQLDLLRNDLGGRSSELSEFYPYRYLASEGFLPGYNFTRLPLRIFLPTSDSSGNFISRPRAIALREFGPLNRIYHNGRKYRVTQLVVQDTESALIEAKISKKSGYFLTAEQKDLEICPFSGLNLGDNANKEHLHHLLEMTESRAEEIDRISCEEEERVSRGYEINTYFTVDGGHLERIRKAVVRSSESALLNLRYVPAARLVHVNRQWRSQQSEGFPIGVVSGDWRSSMPGPDSNFKEEFRLVKLWTSNLADALYIEPIPPLGLKPDGVITLQHALKRAIEGVFQVEPNEIGVVIMGDLEAPNILLYEASEGSLGILSQFVDDITVFHKVVEQAITLCRYDDAGYKGPASYDDLLSYYNQRNHKIIDRHLIKDALEKLRICSIEIQTNTGFGSYEDQYQALLRAVDPNSSTERKFLEFLYQNGLRLPDAAQKRVDGLYVQPDFYYEPRIWVFCDGTPHDDPALKTVDSAKRQSIIAKGDEVWVYYYKDNLAEKVAARPDIFRQVR